jgi:hypothetical protein
MSLPHRKISVSQIGVHRVAKVKIVRNHEDGWIDISLYDSEGYSTNVTAFSEGDELPAITIVDEYKKDEVA